MDPLTIQRLGRIRHEEIVAQASQDTQHTKWTLSAIFTRIWQQIGQLTGRIRVPQQPTAAGYKAARPGQSPVK